jgi:biotin carboxyl carrier protein
VSAGATLCIVEAMKVMNEIKAERRCKVLSILPENGDPVTSGTTLFLVETL